MFDNEKLRNHKILNENEILIQEGDLYIAVNVLTQERRLIKRALVEGFVSGVKQLLKD